MYHVSDADKMQAELSIWYDEFKIETKRRLGEKLIATFDSLLRSTNKAKRLDEAYVHNAFPYDLITGESVKPKYKPAGKVPRGDYFDAINLLFDIINEQDKRISDLEKKLSEMVT